MKKENVNKGLKEHERSHYSAILDLFFGVQFGLIKWKREWESSTVNRESGNENKLKDLFLRLM